MIFAYFDTSSFKEIEKNTIYFDLTFLSLNFLGNFSASQTQKCPNGSLCSEPLWGLWCILLPIWTGGVKTLNLVITFWNPELSFKKLNRFVCLRHLFFLIKGIKNKISLLKMMKRLKKIWHRYLVMPNT